MGSRSAAWVSVSVPTTPRQLTHRKRSCNTWCRAREHDAAPGSDSAQPVVVSRRAALAAIAAAPAAAALPSAAVSPALAADGLTVEELFPGASQSAQGADGELRFSHRVYLDVGACVGGARQNRRLGDKSVLCDEPEPLGRLVIGLYGTLAPTTVANFLKTLEAGAYNGTLFNKVQPGQYVTAGRQGPHRMGYVEPPSSLTSNSDLLSPSAFQLTHLRPGTVSLNLSVNEDDDALRMDRDYRNTSFLITTGPAPVPSLDGQNIVFGQVIEGLDVVAAIASVPTFTPDDKLRAFNDFAKLLGDERAGRARATWGKPITPVVITGSGVLA